MSGPLSVPFVILALWTSNRTQKAAYAGLAIICAVFASFRVWNKQRLSFELKLEDIKSRISEYERVLEIHTELCDEPPSKS